MGVRDMPTRLFRGAFWENLHCVDGIRRGADSQVGPSAYLHLERLVGPWVKSTLRWCGGAGACTVEWMRCGKLLLRMSFSAPTNFARNSAATASKLEL